MTRSISAMELRQKLGEILDRVALRHDSFVIERKGRPLAALVPAEMLDQLQRAAAQLLKETGERSSRDTTQREADALANEAKHATRRSGRRR